LTVRALVPTEQVVPLPKQNVVPTPTSSSSAGTVKEVWTAQVREISTAWPVELVKVSASRKLVLVVPAPKAPPLGEVTVAEPAAKTSRIPAARFAEAVEVAVSVTPGPLCANEVEVDADVAPGALVLGLCV